MHTIKVIAAGYLILSAILLLANAWTTTRPTGGTAVTVFVIAWAAISVLNLWIGIYKAGYTFTEELPILALVFLPPAITSSIAAGWLSRL